MGEKNKNSWKVLGLAAVIMMAVAGVWHGISLLVGGTKVVGIPGDGGKGETPPAKTPAEQFVERLDAADKLIVKPPANWTEAERQAESNLYFWVKQCGDRKLPWYYDDDDVASQRQQICKSWIELLEKREDDIDEMARELAAKCVAVGGDKAWASRSHSFATNECARMELLLNETTYPLLNVTTNTLVRRYGYTTLAKGARAVSQSLGAWTLDNYTKVVSGVHVFSNRQQVVEYVDRLKQDNRRKSEELQRCDTLLNDLAARAKEAMELRKEAADNVELAEKSMKEGSPQQLKEQFTSWRRWVLKSVLLLGD